MSDLAKRTRLNPPIFLGVALVAALALLPPAVYGVLGLGAVKSEADLEARNLAFLAGKSIIRQQRLWRFTPERIAFIMKEHLASDARVRFKTPDGTDFIILNDPPAKPTITAKRPVFDHEDVVGFIEVNKSYRPVLVNTGLFVGLMALPALVAGVLLNRRVFGPMRGAAEELEASEQRFRRLAELSSDGYWTLDAKGRFSSLSQGMEKMGLDPRRVVGAALEAVFDETAPDQLQRVREAVKRQESFMDAAFTFRDAAGEERRLVACGEPVFDRDGSYAGLQGVAVDVTERLKAERLLRAGEAKYRSLYETMHDGFVVVDMAGRYQLSNKAYQDMLGYTEEELSHLTYRDVTPERWWEFEREIVEEQVFKRGFSAVYDKEYRRKDGTVFPIEIRTHLLRDEFGVAQGMWGVIRDITDRKREEEALEHQRERLEAEVKARTTELLEANAKLSRLDELKSALLSFASHELRTPLSSVLGFAKLSAKKFQRHFEPLAQDDALRRQAAVILDNLGVIEMEGRRLARLVDDLLDLNKIESGRMEWHDVPLNLSEEMEIAARIMQGALDAKPSVQLHLDLGSVPPFTADRDRIRQVFVNLLSNALKFSDEGEVRASVKTVAGGEILVRVEDTGPGIPQDELERVFDRFHQVNRHGQDVSKPKGTGLGLSISRQIVERYGGVVWCESEEGGGAAFIIRLPGQVA